MKRTVDKVIHFKRALAGVIEQWIFIEEGLGTAHWVYANRVGCDGLSRYRYRVYHFDVLEKVYMVTYA